MLFTCCKTENLHPPKTNMEPKNQPIEKESHIPNLHVWVQHVNFPGVCSMQKSHKPISIWNSPKTLWQCQGRTRTCWIGGRSYPEFWKKNFPKTIPYWWTISGTLRVLWIVLSNKYGPHHKYYLWFDATTSGPMAGANDFVFRWFICCSFPKMWPPQRLVC